jgi:hypothetical protein
MSSQSEYISVYAKDRGFQVLPHVIVWQWGKGRLREMLFASYVGLPEAVTAVSASVLEGRELSYKNQGYIRSNGDPYKRIERPMGMGDVAHGCVYNSVFELTAIEALPEADQFNRALLLAPDGNIAQAVTDHVISRFGLPREWQHEYYGLLRNYLVSLFVEVNDEFEEWKTAAAAIFAATENQVIEVISDALKQKLLEIPEGLIQGRFDPNWSMSEYMVNNSEQLGRQLSAQQPRHTFDDPIDPAIALLKRIPFPIQAHMIQALVNTMENEIPICGGDMGSGSAARSVITEITNNV